MVFGIIIVSKVWFQENKFVVLSMALTKIMTKNIFVQILLCDQTIPLTISIDWI